MRTQERGKDKKVRNLLKNAEKRGNLERLDE
jgi:hypothetical protein